MWPWKRSMASKTAAQAHAEDAIASSVGGGDSLPAWNAIWDLVQSRDTAGKQEILHELRGYVAESVSGAPVEQALAFEQAIGESLRPRQIEQQSAGDAGTVVRRVRPVPPSPEVRQQVRQAQIETHRAAMRDIGVRPGDGIPMWALYMTRRSKRSWG